MRWDRATVRAVLLGAGLFAEEREIAHGTQFALDDGTRVNVYNTGRILVQGKASPVKTRVQGLLASTEAPAPPDPKNPEVTGAVMYTDGACIGNPGPGGWGVVLRESGAERELSGGYRLTTNNRMELTAVIRGLEALTAAHNVAVHSDSLYVVKAMREGWARRWRANDWRRTKTEGAINADLWARLLDLCDARRVTFDWVRGHAGHPENERADRLANAAAQQANLPADDVYESGGSALMLDL